MNACLSDTLVTPSFQNTVCINPSLCVGCGGTPLSSLHMHLGEMWNVRLANRGLLCIPLDRLRSSYLPPSVSQRKCYVWKGGVGIVLMSHKKDCTRKRKQIGLCLTEYTLAIRLLLTNTISTVKAKESRQMLSFVFIWTWSIMNFKISAGFVLSESVPRLCCLLMY